MEKFIKGVLKLVNSVVLTILNGYTLATLWCWFIVATFAAPVLTIPAAIGLRLVVRYMTFTVPMAYQQEKEKQHAWEEGYSVCVKNSVINYMICGMALLTGYIVKTFFM